MNPYEKLLLQNKAWSEEKLRQDKDFFNRLSHQQKPKFLWIGCSDSRVPANEITGTDPGEVFVHRNIANMVSGTDLNVMSVVEYAVVHLKVNHVVVCGHYACGGVKAAMQSADLGILNPWLRNIRDVYRLHKNKLNAIVSEEDRYDRLVELNVQEQCVNLIKTAAVQKAVRERGLKVHGWVFDIHKGEIKEVVNISAGEWESPVFKYEFE